MAPVHVLQAALFVARHGYAHQFQVLFVPVLRDVVYVHGAPDEQFFQFISYHDMKMVGKFICFGADQGGFYLIYAFIKLFRGNLAQLFGEIRLQHR